MRLVLTNLIGRRDAKSRRESHRFGDTDRAAVALARSGDGMLSDCAHLWAKRGGGALSKSYMAKFYLDLIYSRFTDLFLTTDLVTIIIF